jgi:hypothetical protein
MLAAFLVLQTALGALPTEMVAPYLVYTTSDLVDLKLRGFHPQGKTVVHHITSKPTTGSLIFPAQVYCDYKYTPKEGAAVGSLPAKVSCKSVSVLYKFPATHVVPHGPLDRFEYRVEEYDTPGKVSRLGVVHLLSNERLLAASNFNDDAEGWTVDGNGASTAVTYDPTSRGAMNRYISHVEAWIDTNMGTGEDNALWYYRAPAKYLGDMAASYGGTLSFTLSAASGDFSAANLTPAKDLVVLECDTCVTATQNRGVKLYYNAQKAGASGTAAPQWSFDGTTTAFVVPLTEAAWRLDSENSNVAPVAPTQCELVQVLKRLSAVRIMGDHTKGFESVSLDSVKLKPKPNTVAPVPLACYSTMLTAY